MSNPLLALSELSPLRKLLVAMLAAVVLAQIAAMTLVVNSQVQKAQQRAALESAQRLAVVAPATVAPSAAPAVSVPSARGGLMTVGYASVR